MAHQPPENGEDELWALITIICLLVFTVLGIYALPMLAEMYMRATGR